MSPWLAAASKETDREGTPGTAEYTYTRPKAPPKESTTSLVAKAGAYTRSLLTSTSPLLVGYVGYL